MTSGQKFARSCVVMITAGGDKSDILELARLHGVKPVHLDQLAVPAEEEASRVLLKGLLGQN